MREGVRRIFPLDGYGARWCPIYPFRGFTLMPSVLIATLIAALAASPLDTPRFGDVKLSTGITMYYAEQGEPRGEPIILLHGYSDSWFSFSRVLTPLAREARVFALDLRGH